MADWSYTDDLPETYDEGIPDVTAPPAGGGDAPFEHSYDSGWAPQSTQPDPSLFESSGGGGAQVWPDYDPYQKQTPGVKVVTKNAPSQSQSQAQADGGGGGGGGIWGMVGDLFKGLGVAGGMASQGYFAQQAVKEQYKGEVKLLREFKRQRHWLANKASADFTKQLSAYQVSLSAAAQERQKAATEKTRTTALVVYGGLGALVLAGLGATYFLLKTPKRRAKR